MGCGIYKIVSKIDNKIYIGSSVNLNSRNYKHFWMLNKNVHDNRHLQSAYNKFGKDNFFFEVVELCDFEIIIERENYHIDYFKSNDPNYGYNLSTVNEFRRNSFNDEVKLKLSRYNLEKNSNFNLFKLENIFNNEIKIFDNLVNAANYLIDNSFSKGSPRNVRQKLSFCLRNKKVNNGKHSNGSIRKTCYKHKFEIIN